MSSEEARNAFLRTGRVDDRLMGTGEQYIIPSIGKKQSANYSWQKPDLPGQFWDQMNLHPLIDNKSDHGYYYVSLNREVQKVVNQKIGKNKDAWDDLSVALVALAILVLLAFGLIFILWAFRNQYKNTAYKKQRDKAKKQRQRRIDRVDATTQVQLGMGKKPGDKNRGLISRKPDRASKLKEGRKGKKLKQFRKIWQANKKHFEETKQEIPDPPEERPFGSRILVPTADQPPEKPVWKLSKVVIAPTRPGTPPSAAKSQPATSKQEPAQSKEAGNEPKSQGKSSLEEAPIIMTEIKMTDEKNDKWKASKVKIDKS